MPLQRVGPDEVRQILAVTDALGLHRESVSIPLLPKGNGTVRVTATQRVEIVVPSASDFKPWLAALPDALRDLDLTGVRRVG
jgi:hypothetical protein